MIFTVILAATAVFLGWLGLRAGNPELGGMFLVAALITAGCAVVWYLNARRLRRLP